MRQFGEWEDEQTEPDHSQTGPDEEDADGEGRAGQNQTVGADGEQDEPDLIYPSVEAFVTGWLAPTYGRYIGAGARTWCPWWWKHPEGIVRLQAIWRAWEHLRQDAALGGSVFLLEHADPHMAVLFDPSGPFKGCTPERGHDPRSHPLPVVPADPGTFTTHLAATPEAPAQADAPLPAGEVSDPRS